MVFTEGEAVLQGQQAFAGEFRSEARAHINRFELGQRMFLDFPILPCLILERGVMPQNMLAIDGQAQIGHGPEVIEVRQA